MAASRTAELQTGPRWKTAGWIAATATLFLLVSWRVSPIQQHSQPTPDT